MIHTITISLRFSFTTDPTSVDKGARKEESHDVHEIFDEEVEEEKEEKEWLAQVSMCT